MGLFGFGGEFAGIDENNVESFIQALSTFRSKIEEILSEFNQRSGSISMTFANEALQGQVSGYLDAVKQYLIALLQEIQSEEERIVKSAFEQWGQGGSAVQANVDSEAAAIRSAAGNIILD